MVEDQNNMPEARAGITAALQEGMRSVHEETLQQVDSNWQQGKDAMGNQWPSLDPSTVAAKGFADILIETGELRQDVQQSSRFDAKTNTSIITSSLDYAGAHEFGVPEQNIPARPFLGPAGTYAESQIDSEVVSLIDNILAGLEVR